VPAVLDIGAGNFSYVLKKLDKYWANDTRYSERNLLWDTIDETLDGTITAYDPQYDTDFDGVLDRPNFENPDACPNPDPVCDDPENPDYPSASCVTTRRARDRCVADNLLTWYERETDTLIVRPLLPLDEMTRYAVVITDRMIDGRGNAVKSPFEHVFHAAQRRSAERVAQIIDDPYFAPYFGDVAGTGINRVAFMWSFTTQPTVDDLRRLRDGLYGTGPFARWAEAYPPALELQRLVGLTSGLAEGKTDQPDWATSELGVEAGCGSKSDNLWVIQYEGLRSKMKELVESGFEIDPGPDAQLLLSQFDNVSHMVIGTFESPYLLEGGPESIDPNAAFNINYLTGESVETTDTVQFWMIIPKETEQHKQPFDINIFGHGYTSTHLEQILYAGNMAAHGIATISINAMGHGLVMGIGEATAATAALGGACYAPTFDALTLGRTRDLNHDGEQDSGGDFWSSYLFHTRDGVRQSILDHIQLVRILRTFGADEGMACRDDADTETPVRPCNINGATPVMGDFDADGTIDVGGPDSSIGTWGESLGGVLSGIHGAIDAFVTSAVPGSGGGGLTDIGVRSFQGGVIEAVLLRIWGPLMVTVPAESRKLCEPSHDDGDHCTICSEGQLSLRWVVPDVNGTGEVEIDCLEKGTIDNTTVRVHNHDNDEVACARIGENGRFRIGLPSTTGDRISVEFWDQIDAVTSYDGCVLTGSPELRHQVEQWGIGRHVDGAVNGDESDFCDGTTCSSFQGTFFAEGSVLTAPSEGFGLIRQTPALRRFISLAQAALEPGDPISFAPYYALKQMTDPHGNTIAPHAVLTLNTIGDQNVPLNAGIAFARATGALPFLNPYQASAYPDYADYVTPQALYDALGGRTPNQELIDAHVIEGITELARHPAESSCVTSSNFDPPGSTYVAVNGELDLCFPTGCTEDTESDGDTRICYGDQHCDLSTSTCVANDLGTETCDEALYDSDDLDEGRHQYGEQTAATPHRLARLTASVGDLDPETVWGPRLQGVPGSNDDSAWSPQPAPAGRLTALLNAYTVPEGEHTFVNGNPCHAFDHGTYLTNLVARFFQSDGTDLYYLSHPASHHCLEQAQNQCDYMQP